jgi:hypothetical protein
MLSMDVAAHPDDGLVAFGDKRMTTICLPISPWAGKVKQFQQLEETIGLPQRGETLAECLYRMFCCCVSAPQSVSESSPGI